MKTIAIILLLLIPPCFRPAVEVLDASSQRDVPGRKESPVSVHYEIRVETGRSSDNLAITKIYVHGQPCEVKIMSGSGEEVIGSFSKRDTLLLRCTFFERGGQETGEKNLPETLREEELVIAYSLRGKKRYLPVKQIRRMPEKIRL